MRSSVLLLLYLLMFVLQVILLVLCVKEEKEGKWKPLFISEIFTVGISSYQFVAYIGRITGILSHWFFHCVFYYFIIGGFISLFMCTMIWYKIIHYEE